MDWDTEKIGDFCASLVMLAVAVALVALVLAGAAWALVRVWPF